MSALEVAHKHMKELEQEPHLSVTVQKAIIMRRMSEAGYSDRTCVSAIEHAFRKGDAQ